MPWTGSLLPVDTHRLNVLTSASIASPSTGSSGFFAIAPVNTTAGMAEPLAQLDIINPRGRCLAGLGGLLAARPRRAAHVCAGSIGCGKVGGLIPDPNDFLKRPLGACPPPLTRQTAPCGGWLCERNSRRCGLIAGSKCYRPVNLSHARLTISFGCRKSPVRSDGRVANPLPGAKPSISLARRLYAALRREE